MTTVLNHPDAYVRIEEGRTGKRMILIEPKGELFVPFKAWETAYPLDLIEHVLQVKGPAHLCDEIMRDEDTMYVPHHFRWDILSYIEENAFSARRILDFGAGSGASSIVLARMLPADEIVGVELVQEHVELARYRATFYGIERRVKFYLLPYPNSLPTGIWQ